LGKKTQLVFALGLISLAVFIVGSFMGVICPMNANIPNTEWQDIGNRNCLNTESILHWLTDFVEFIRAYFA
jgi:hypothetical protein